MSALSDYAENAVGNHLLRNVALPSPTTVYLALFTADPTDAGTGAEVTGGSYIRKAVTFGAPTNGVFTNNASVTFESMPSTTVTHWGIFDAVTAGNLLFHGAWQSATGVNAGQNLSVAIGALTITGA